MTGVRRLYRSENEKMIGGVAGGVADFAGVDPTLVRVIFVALTVFGGSGLLIYLVMWVLVPKQSKVGAWTWADARATTEEMRQRAEQARTAYEQWRHSPQRGPASAPDDATPGREHTEGR